MVSLAKKYKDSPFVIILSGRPGATLVSFTPQLKAGGWSEDVKNLSMSGYVTIPGRNGGFTPYYVIFDADGKVRRQNVAGSHHGGDGQKYRELVEELLAEFPADKKPARVGSLSKMRQWTNREGKTMRAVLLSVIDGTGKFRLNNNKIQSYPLVKLSDKDQEFIRELTQAE